ncbi:hypothetical protein A374_16323 [Fictibacillus macauensis ZFHKF-1]|uniref:DUF3784 domain-containing protein n=1 Tax=Fictibacillus macauensis ZFHKF-1 TaxID=1196324 RepID=I8AG49_9BACL|nr:hypothetical protein [Fictibacillus macauensis]EIT84369.1 hypothetical protein A374_16323 [Fictibacillus macauensis ZFHKF-1]
MIVVMIIFNVFGLSAFVFAYFLRKKKLLHVIAGYSEGSIAEEDKQAFGNVNSFFAVLTGLVLCVFGTFFITTSVFYLLGAMVVVGIVQIVYVNVRFRDRGKSSQ